MIALVLFGLYVCAWCAYPACGEGKVEDVSLLKRLKALDRELLEAREQGNDAEVAEIEMLMEELREAAADGYSQNGDRADKNDEADAVLRERLTDLERELELARKSGNEPEVEEIQELMARLTTRIRGEGTSTAPRVGTIEVDIDNISNVKVSSAACGFALAYPLGGIAACRHGTCRYSCGLCGGWRDDYRCRANSTSGRTIPDKSSRRSVERPGGEGQLLS